MDISVNDFSSYENDRTTEDLDIFFWIFNVDYGFVPTHWHRAIEINYILEGEVDITVNGKTTALLPGDLFLIDSYIPHSVSSIHGNNAILIQLPYSLLKKYIPDFDNLSFSLDCHTPNPIIQTKITQFTKIIRDMEILFKIQPKGYTMRFNSLVFEMMFQLFHNFSSSVSYNDLRKRQKNYEKLAHIMDYTNEHYKNAVSIDEIAAVACFQKEYFCHYFKKNMGLTYLEYLNELRLSHVCEDLLSTELPLKNILENNGFTNYKLFRKLFYRKFMLTPSEYRKANKSHAADTL